jgi:hypothetical protein
MKTLAIIAAGLAISLALVRTASADSFSIMRTGMDAFSIRRGIIPPISKDDFGTQRSVIQNNSDNGISCQTVTLRSADAIGDPASRTMRRCAPDS